MKKSVKHQPRHLLICITPFLAALLFLTTITKKSSAQTKNKYRSAKESDPVKMGWMQGFPPPDDKIIKVGGTSFFTFPKMRYSVCHMRQFLPTVNVSRGLKPQTPFEYALDDQINDIPFQPWDADTTMTWEESLWKNYTDGIVILHGGTIVYERYFGCLTEKGKHAPMSVTKSFTGTLASILVAEGTLDETAKVATIIPELKDSGFGDATVRQVMDMTTALQYSEDYSDPNAEIWTYSKAGNPMPKPRDYDGPVGYFEYLQTVKKQGTHGEAFGYRTINADALGWIISRATGESVDDLLSDRIWSKLGMEQSAYYQVDALGTPFAGGGLSAGMRDMARFGELMLNNGQWKGQQVIPEGAVADIRKGGSKEAFKKSDHPGLKGWSYRNMWWITENEDGAFAARGVHGQTIYVDPKADMVIVRFASHPVAANAANDPTSLPAYQAVADYLMKQ
jgi:CubicO group peptidase (beta-lactamase class C family)